MAELSSRLAVRRVDGEQYQLLGGAVVDYAIFSWTPRAMNQILNWLGT